MTRPHSMDNMIKHIKDTPVYIIPDMLPAETFTSLLANKKSEQCNDDPFYIMDIGQVHRQYEQFHRCMPSVKPFYAVKCNNDPLLMEVLAKLGCGFDCASKAEIEQVLSMGIEPERIIYANPCKTSSHLRYAAESAVSLMTFDSESELRKIKKIYPDARVVLRILVSDPTAVCQLNLKFGAEPETLAPRLLTSAALMGINVVGISFHVGSGCRDPTAYGDAIMHARRLMDMGRGLGHEMSLLDIGGGFPGFPTNDITFEDIARVVNTNLELYFPCTTTEDVRGDDQVRVIAEPGRFFAAAAYTLCCNVISAKEIPANRIAEDASADEIGYFYYLNDGAYGSFNCILYDHAVPYCYAVGKPTMQTDRCSIWGPTCDSFDCIMPATRLPRLDAGDWLVFPKMGAYTIAAYSDFNGFERPDVYFVCSASEWLALESEISGRSSVICEVVDAIDAAPVKDSVGVAAEQRRELMDATFKIAMMLHLEDVATATAITLGNDDGGSSSDLCSKDSMSSIMSGLSISGDDAGGPVLAPSEASEDVEDDDRGCMVRGYRCFDPS